MIPAQGEPQAPAVAPAAEVAAEEGILDASTAPALVAPRQPQEPPLAARAPLAPTADVSLAIGTLDPGETLVITFDVTVNNPLAAGVNSVSNQGSVSGSNVATLLTNDPDTATANDPTLTTIDAVPDLTLSKSDGGASVAPGGTVAYTLSYANNGSQGATGLSLTETVPANSSFNAGASTAGWSCTPDNSAGSSCTFAVAALAAGGSGSVTFAVTVAGALPAATTSISNSATVADDGSNGTDANAANNNGSDSTPLAAGAFYAAPDAATCGSNVPCLYGATAIQAALTALTDGGSVTVLGSHAASSALGSGAAGANDAILIGGANAAIQWTGSAGALFNIATGDLTVKGLELSCAGSDCLNTVAFNHTGGGALLAYANDIVDFGTGYSSSGGAGPATLRHNWWGAAASATTVGQMDAFDFRLGADVEAWSESGTLADSGNGRNAQLTSASGSGTPLIVSHGRGAANAPFGKSDPAAPDPCSDYYDFFVVGGSAGSTWDVTVPIDSSPAGCESNTAGGTAATNRLFHFALTAANAPDTACGLCWLLFDSITRNGASSPFSLTAQAVPVAELGGTPVVAGNPDGSPPLAALLAAFAATGQESAILVTWSSVSELTNLGYNLYRSPTADGQPMLLNAELIPSEAPGAPDGFSYQWLDEALLSGERYFYWLESVGPDGSTLLFGPISASVGVPTALVLGTLTVRGGAADGAALLALPLLALAALAWRRRARR